MSDITLMQAIYQDAVEPWLVQHNLSPGLKAGMELCLRIVELLEADRLLVNA